MNRPTMLITGGCSYSQIPNTDVAWPLPLQESLGVRYVAHTGHGAAGNQLISRKVISKVIKAIELGHKPEDMIVGIMWSGCDRHSHYSENLDKNHSKTRIIGFGGSYQEMLFAHTYNTPPAAIIDLENFNGEMDQHQNYSNPLSIRNSKKPAHYILNSHWQDELTTKYFEDFVNPEKAIIETCEHILRTQWFLKDKGIRYFMTEYDHDVFTYMGPSYEGVYSDNTECLFRPEEYSKERHFAYIENPEINYLYNEIDKNYWLPVKNLQDWVTNISVHQHTRMNAEGTPADPHPSTEQHKEFVNKVILPFLLEKYNIK